jgi:hypothetical protein
MEIWWFPFLRLGLPVGKVLGRRCLLQVGFRCLRVLYVLVSYRLLHLDMGAWVEEAVDIQTGVEILGDNSCMILNKHNDII